MCECVCVCVCLESSFCVCVCVCVVCVCVCVCVCLCVCDIGTCVYKKVTYIFYNDIPLKLLRVEKNYKLLGPKGVWLFPCDAYH